jgi:RHS repeat-associated protein
MLARYQSGNQGRFISQDPMVKNIAGNLSRYGKKLPAILVNPQEMNSYSYVANNPLRLVDPTGETLWDVATGRQSWNNYVVEVGEGAQMLYEGSGFAKAAMDHPVGTGAVVGVGSGLALVGGSCLAGVGYTGLGIGADALTIGTIGTGACTGGGCQQAQKMLNPTINITSKGINHVIDGHTIGGINSAGKSIFNSNIDISALIKSGTQQAMKLQSNGNYQRVYDAGKKIGIDQSGKQTSWITIITNKAGELITSHPGTPAVLIK